MKKIMILILIAISISIILTSFASAVINGGETFWITQGEKVTVNSGAGESTLSLLNVSAERGCYVSVDYWGTVGTWVSTQLESVTLLNIKFSVLAVTPSTQETTKGLCQLKILAMNDAEIKIVSRNLTSTPVASCTDSDGGKNYYVKGSLKYTNNPYGILEEEDSCADSHYLIEGVCNSNTEYTQNHERYYCQYGCSNGVCLKAEQIGGDIVWLTQGEQITKTWNNELHSIKVLKVSEQANGCQLSIDDALLWATKGETLIVKSMKLKVNDFKLVSTGDICQVIFYGENSGSKQEISPSATETNKGLNEKTAVVAPQPTESQPTNSEPTQVAPQPTTSEPTQTAPNAAEPQQPTTPSQPTQETKPAENTCNGCDKDGLCIPVQARKSGSYCDLDKTLKQEKEKGVCDNNFECTSNLCLNNECVAPSLWKRILAWFGFLN